MTRRLLLPALAVGVVVAAAAVAMAVPSLPARTSPVPTARVQKGSLKLTVHASGEVQPGRTAALITPAAGGMLRIVKLVPTGTTVKAGQAVVEFDPSEQMYAVEQARSELLEAEQAIVKTRADAAVRGAQDDVAMLTARFDVRRAELDASGNEFIGALDAQKNLLSFEEARRRLAQLQEDVKSRAATNQATLAVADEKRTKARLAMERAQQVIDTLVIRAPFDGVISLKQNQDATGGFMFFGMVLPEFREGDQVWGGRPVADVLQAGRMEVHAKIDESDRPNLVSGQPAVVEVDSVPGEKFKAHLGELAGLASTANFWDSSSATRLFDATLQFDQPDTRLKAGVSVKVTLEGKDAPGVLHVPRQAVFDKNGKNHVFVRTGDRFEPREVTVQQRTETRVALTGVTEGTEIALVDPNARAAPGPSGGGIVPPGGGASR